MNRNRKLELLVFVVTAIIIALLPLRFGEYYLFLIRLIGINLIVALGLNIFMGYCGQINIGASAFYCIGAYTSAVFQAKWGWHCIAAFPASLALNLLIAWSISFPLLRLRGHSLAIGTIAFAVTVNLLVDRFPQLTGGGDGMYVPKMLLFGTKMGNIFYYYVILIFGALAFLFCYFMGHSSIGRALKAIKEDEVAAEAVGIDVHRFRMLAWIVSGGFGGLAGLLYAQQAEFLAPMTFGLMSNVNFLLIVFVGGLGTNIGVVLGAVVITILSYLMISIQQYGLLVNGAVLFFILRFLPDGIAGGIGRFFRYMSKRELSFPGRSANLFT